MSIPETARFVNGLSTVAASDVLAQLPYPDPTAWRIYMHHMAVLPTTLGWTHTQTNGTLAVASSGITQTLGGADNDLSQLYMSTAAFALVGGKKFFFEAKCQVDKGAAGTIGLQELFIGMTSVQTGNNFFAADGLSMTADDVLGFSSYATSANINIMSRATDVESVHTAVTTYIDATSYVYTIYYDGTVATFYKNGTSVGSINVVTAAAMVPCLYIKAGEAKAPVLTTAYCLVAAER